MHHLVSFQAVGSSWMVMGRKHSVWQAPRWSHLLESHNLLLQQGGRPKARLNPLKSKQHQFQSLSQLELGRLWLCPEGPFRADVPHDGPEGTCLGWGQGTDRWSVPGRWHFTLFVVAPSHLYTAEHRFRADLVYRNIWRYRSTAAFVGATHSRCCQREGQHHHMGG